MSRKLHNARSLYLEGIRDGNPREAVSKYTGDRYTQHSTGVADGREGFIAFFEPFLRRNPDRHIEVVRGFEDGQYVFVHVYQNLNQGQAEWVTMDFFDTDENDRIIEHWDVIVPYRGLSPTRRTQIDGPAECLDLEATAANKKLVRDMIEHLLMTGGDPDSAGDYIHPEYIQHDPDMLDGLAPFMALLKSPQRSLWYRDIVLLVGCGNFVATLCRVHWGNTEYAQADLYRLANGRIVEHWDAAEPVPDEQDLVNSGKF